jgi:peptide/nickel transport system substrate-binding protein
MTLTTQTTDRRKLLTTGLAAGLLAASGLALGSAPRVGGRLRAALPGAGASDSWDARQGFGLFMQAAGQGAVFDCLTEVAADGSLRGELATSWEASRDARKWVFDLRRGVRFHNGAALTAGSVVESIHLHLQAGAKGAAWPVVSNIDSVRALGPHQVQFTLHLGNADFPYLLSDRHLIIYPEGQVSEAMRDGIGTGLYRAARFEPGQRFVGWRVGEHYKDGSAGWFDQVEFLAAKDAADRLALLTSGGVEALGQLDPAHAAVVQQTAGLRLTATPGNQHVALDLPTDGAFADLRVRQAVQAAVDRNAVLFDAAEGYGQPGFDSPVGPFNQYFGWAEPGHDPDRAAHLLRQAGHAPGSVGLGLGELSGLPVNLISALWPALLAAGFARAERPNATLRLSSGRVTEDWALSALPSAQADLNPLRAEAMASFDPGHKADLYSEIQSRLRSSASTVIPVFTNFLQATTTRLTHPAALGNLWPLDNARLAERWWLA